ncbi:hypothetical protein [Lentzea sp. NPDC055074]
MSWEALGHNPVPGDPAGVKQVAHRLGTVSLGATEASDRLDAINRGLSSAQWTGAAAEVFGRSVADLVPDLRKLSTSFTLAESALLRYADELESAQRTAAQAETDARDAGTERTGALARKAIADQESAQHRRAAQAALAALTAARTAQTLAVATGDAAGAAREQARAEQSETQRVRAGAAEAAARSRSGVAAGQIAGAEARQQAARRLAEAAREVREDAGRRAVAEIDDASDAGIQNKNIGDHVGEWWNGVVRSPEFDQFLNVLDKVSDVLLAVAPLMPIVCAIGGGIIGLVGGPASFAAGYAAGKGIGAAMSGIGLAGKAVVLAGRAEQYRTGARGAEAVSAAALGVGAAAISFGAGKLGGPSDLDRLGAPITRMFSVTSGPVTTAEAVKLSTSAGIGAQNIVIDVHEATEKISELRDGPSDDEEMLDDSVKDGWKDGWLGARDIIIHNKFK